MSSEGVVVFSCRQAAGREAGLVACKASNSKQAGAGAVSISLLYRLLGSVVGSCASFGDVIAMQWAHGRQQHPWGMDGMGPLGWASGLPAALGPTLVGIDCYNSVGC
jgi:hypothetical protein